MWLSTMIRVGTSSVRRKLSSACASRCRIVGVADVLHVPAVGKEARCDIVAESQVRVPFDGYPVAVVNPAQVTQHLVTGERGCFARYAFHHVAVAADRIDVVVEYRKTRTIEVPSQPACGERHAHRIAAALPERTGRRLDTAGQTVLRVAGTFAAELSKPPDIVDRDGGRPLPLLFAVYCFHAAEMEHGIEQHRGMAIGKHEAVSIGPGWIVGIKTQKALPQRVNHRRQGHWRPRMAGVGLLNGIHREGANGVYAKLIGRGAVFGSSARYFNGSGRHEFGCG